VRKARELANEPLAGSIEEGVGQSGPSLACCLRVCLPPDFRLPTRQLNNPNSSQTDDGRQYTGSSFLQYYSVLHGQDIRSRGITVATLMGGVLSTSPLGLADAKIGRDHGLSPHKDR